MSAEQIAQRQEIISNYIAENVEFKCNIKQTILKPVYAVLEKFKTHLSDLQFLKVDDEANDTIILYTNYNFKFEIFAKHNMKGTFEPEMFCEDNMYIVYLYPLEDKTTFFPNEDCYNNNEYHAPLYVNKNNYLLVQLDNKYDMPFDITQCNYKKGIWPCVLMGSMLQDDSSDRDYLIQKFMDHLIANF
jgi:hypothetical protein